LEEYIVTQTLSQEFQNIWPIIALNDFLRYAIAASLLASILFVFRRMLAQRRIQDRHAGWKDIRREVTYSLLTIVIFSLVGFGTYFGGQHGLFRLSTEMPTLWSGLFDFVVIVLAHDAYFYWAHRTMHHPRLYRHFHRLHHRSVTPTPWTAYSFAPLEAVVEAAFLPLIFLFFESSQLVAFAFTSHMIVRNVIGHAGVELFPNRWLHWPIARLITTTTHHDLHHLEFRWNYGLYFTWWDRLMGTEHPQYQERFLASVSRNTDDGELDGETGISGA
jgi:sterol desaturase/sphingolipid hydroxylase (fatty acid hydroxylase superfamily)